MDLPPELREKVYEGLLCPHIDGRRHREVERIRYYGLQPAILRTCKVVCEEGLRVLYGKNSTFLLHLDAHACTKLNTEYRPEFSSRLPITRVDCGKTGGKSLLTVDLSVLDKFLPKPKARRVWRGTTRKKGKKRKQVPEKHDAPENQNLFIGFLSALPKFCRFLASSSVAAKLQLVVHMETPQGRPPQNCKELALDSLDYLCEAQGLGKAVILTEPEYGGKAKGIAKLMMTELKTASRIANAYETRFLRFSKGKRWNDARDTLENALGFMAHIRPYLTDTPQDIDARTKEMQWRFISCCLKVGRTGDVRHLIRRMFPYDWNDKDISIEDREHLADAHCAIGKSYVVDGALNCAAWSFLQALLTTPGHVEADRAIDELEEQVKSSSRPEEMIAKWNIERVLKDVRHRGYDHDPLTENATEDLLDGFIAKRREIQELLPDPYSRFSGISFMEPLDAFIFNTEDEY